MIQSVGIDAVEIDRFALWRSYSPKRLKKLFSEGEIGYCMAEPGLPQRFAVRFAAKEALYKAISSAYGSPPPFFTLCQTSEIVMELGIPRLVVDWDLLKSPPLQVHVSLTHTKTTAHAIVILIKAPIGV